VYDNIPKYFLKTPKSETFSSTAFEVRHTQPVIVKEIEKEKPGR
jgi:hypothetical protein